MKKIIRRKIYIFLRFLTKVIYFIKALIFLSINKKKYTENKFYVLHHWAFGWQVVFIFLIYTYSKRKNTKINIINFIYKRNNPHMVDFFFNHNSFINYQINTKYDFFNIVSHEAFILALDLFPKIKKNMITNENIFQYFKYRNRGVDQWSFEEKKLLKYFDFSWFDNLINKNKLSKKNIQKEFLEYSKEIYEKKLKNLIKDKQIASIAFRDQYSNYKSDKMRQNFRVNNYIPAIKWLIDERNYIFVNHNRNFNKYFKNIDGVINLSEVMDNKKDYYYMNLYIYHVNKLFISTLSGSHLFTALFDKKIMLGDVWPISTGVPGGKNILLPVNYSLNNKKVSLNKILIKYPNIFFGSDRVSIKKKIKIFPNSKSQILKMVKQKNLKKVKNLPKNSLVFYRKNWFCII